MWRADGACAYRPTTPCAKPCMHGSMARCGGLRTTPTRAPEDVSGRARSGGSGELAARARRRRVRPDRDAPCLSVGACFAQGRPCWGVQPAPPSETSLPASSPDPLVARSSTVVAALSSVGTFQQRSHRRPTPPVGDGQLGSARARHSDPRNGRAASTTPSGPARDRPGARHSRDSRGPQERSSTR
jgi:hypothetical protein